MPLNPFFLRAVYNGVEFSNRLCGVSIIRSGESMENALRVRKPRTSTPRGCHSTSLLKY